MNAKAKLVKAQKQERNFVMKVPLTDYFYVTRSSCLPNTGKQDNITITCIQQFRMPFATGHMNLYLDAASSSH